MRGGSDVILPRDKETGATQHTLVNVYREMFLQISTDYNVLPDPRSITFHEIRFYYEGLRPSLQKHTAPRKEEASSKPVTKRKPR